MKTLRQSKTIRGAIIMILVPLLDQFGIELVIIDQAQLVEYIITIIGFGLTIYGRYKAEKKIVL